VLRKKSIPIRSRLSKGLRIVRFAADQPAVAFCMTMSTIRAINHSITILSAILLDVLRFVSLGVRSNAALRAENLFLRRQLTLFTERKVTARRADDGTRLIPVLLSRQHLFLGSRQRIFALAFAGKARVRFSALPLARIGSPPRDSTQLATCLQASVFPCNPLAVP
jgi:hypothetical protein